MKPSSDACAQLADYVGTHLGLHFPPDRWADLQRGFEPARAEFGFDDAAACIDWLAATPPTAQRLQVLAAHLTIGETYFYREQPTLDALSATALAELIRERRGGSQRLRLWSAGCCTGEEAYTLAILVRRLLPDFADWQVTIAATDLNARFLQKAAAGIYGEWSFRGAPAWLKERYFERVGEGAAVRFRVAPEIRRMVSFRQLNLVDDAPPADLGIFDVILCRNVLMYFTRAQRDKAIGRLDSALAEGGWLAVSPSEASHALFPRLRSTVFPGAILFRKLAQQPVAAPAAPPGAAVDADPLPAVGADDDAPADTPPRAAVAEDGESIGARARSLADAGRLDDALDCCDRWLALDKLDASAHWLRAVVLLERRAPGDVPQARKALQRAVFLRPDFVMAQVALGNLAESLGRRDLAERHRATAARLAASDAAGAYAADAALQDAADEANPA